MDEKRSKAHSKEAAETARKLIQSWIDADIPIYAGSGLVIHQDIALALDRFRAEERERPADKILRGLRGALSATQLTNAILDLLPPSVVTPQLQNQIIVILSPHVSGEPS